MKATEKSLIIETMLQQDYTLFCYLAAVDASKQGDDPNCSLLENQSNYCLVAIVS